MAAFGWLLIACGSAQAVVIGQAVTPTIAQEVNVTSFTLTPPPALNPAATVFDRWIDLVGPGDTFGYAARGGGNEAGGVVDNDAAFSILDDSSTFTTDVVGIVRSTDFDNFFGVSDTYNNESDPKILDPFSATWTFDVTGSSNLNVAVDIAAMGDFEATGANADNFSFSYSYDGVNFTSILPIIVREDLTLDYAMEGVEGVEKIVNVADPLELGGTLITNQFVTFSESIAAPTSSTLSVKFTALTDGGTEGFAFRNLTINSGEITPGLIGDYNNDNVVDAADYTVWRDGGSPDSSQAGYDAWAGNYGATAAPATSVAIPEPTAALLAMIALAGLASRRA
jgi:hypothetical protein